MSAKEDGEQELSTDQLIRFARHLSLPQVGQVGQLKLQNARVCVVGAGGLGAPIIQYLAAAGVGMLTVIDNDVVSASNLQRQVIYRTADIGSSKSRTSAEVFRQMNPTGTCNAVEARITGQNAAELLKGHDVVVDGSDNFETRYVVSDAASELGIPHVWGSVFRFEGQVAVFTPESATYRDLYPEQPPAALSTSCEAGGVLGVLCGTVGSLMATEVVKALLGMKSELEGAVLIYDAEKTSFDLRGVPKETRPPAAQPVPMAAIDVEEVDCQWLRSAMLSDNPPLVLDVREGFELEISSLPGARHRPLGSILLAEGLDEGLRNREIVTVCKSGMRSGRAARRLNELGAAEARSLRGGLDAWRAEVDPTMAAY